MSFESKNFSDFEEVLKVFPQAVQKAWKDNPDVVQYMTDLSSVGLQSLCQEPERLSEEKASILEQTQDLAFHNYKTFIQTAECSHEIFQDFNIIEGRLESLLCELPKFTKKCQAFVQEAHDINSRWHQASLTLAKHPQLLEFLEMPQLMDTYVRNGYYEEALELVSYVRRLDKKHSSIPIIASIVKDIQGTLNLMLSQLLTQLKSNIQLPACLKAIGFLRRMDVFSEPELRIKFLQARNTWFQNIINDISKSDAHNHIMKVIESSRIHLFDVITQYRAIFSDDDPSLLSSKESLQTNCAIFQSWIVLKVSQFLNTLEEDLMADLGGRVDSVLMQCMYFGLSFSRVGVDFRPLLIPIFERVTLFKFSSAVENAFAKFESTMQSYTIANYTSVPNMSSSFLSDTNLQPPHSLIDFYPLAEYCNDLLIAFNELKLCASLPLVSDITISLEQSLKRMASVIADFHAAEKSSFTKNEQEQFAKFCLQFANELLPHIEKCLTTLFPSSEITKVLGVTESELLKIGRFGSLDMPQILLPLQEILPSKDDDFGITIIAGIKDSTNDDAKLPSKEN